MTRSFSRARSSAVVTSPVGGELEARVERVSPSRVAALACPATPASTNSTSEAQIQKLPNEKWNSCTSQSPKTSSISWPTMMKTTAKRASPKNAASSLGRCARCPSTERIVAKTTPPMRKKAPVTWSASSH